MKPTSSFENELANSSSPYLLQHKNNPVNWVPWSENAFKRAEKEDKLIIVSIGYSACHWCHVMEHECFEDEGIAKIMNDHFICIKVDREERPDVDKVYMEALQIMSGQGGWPLNCFTLPNKQPFFGGTYFPKDKWRDVMYQIISLKKSNANQLIEYGNRIASGMNEGVLRFSAKSAKVIQKDEVIAASKLWKSRMDNELGGFLGAPKFPLPASYKSLLKLGILKNDQEVLSHVRLTLDEMCRGGIYDQIGGGFTRYSVDDKWKVPHFEKMLYDNAQLIGLYAEGYQAFGSQEYKNIVEETIDFCCRELMDKDGLFYCALDADSEGVEGKYYVWDEFELKRELGKNFEFARLYYNFNAFGEWEGNYIPLLQMEDQEVAQHFDMTIEEVIARVKQIKSTLFSAREKRIRPGLDSKILCSWNALMISGLLSAHQALQKKSHLSLALRSMDQLIENYYQPASGKVVRTYTKAAPIEGFLDDYAHLTHALIHCFEVSCDERYIHLAHAILNSTIDSFYNENIGAFEFSPRENRETFAAQVDFIDEVIPSANAVMAKCLYKLSVYMGNVHFEQIADRLVKAAYSHVMNQPYNFSCWYGLLLDKAMGKREIIIVGPEAKSFLQAIQPHIRWNDWVLVSTTESELPIFKDRFLRGETRTFVCENKACGLPIAKLDDLLTVLQQ